MSATKILFCILMVPCLFFVSRAFSGEREIVELALRSCLRDCYGIEASDLIVEKFRPLLDNVQYQEVVPLFIAKSYDAVAHSVSVLSEATVEATDVTEAHQVVAETDRALVLWSEMHPGTFEQAHQHRLYQIIVVVSGSEFVMTYADGTVEREYYPVGVYEFSPEKQACSYINVSNDIYRGFHFEFKGVQK